MPRRNWKALKKEWLTEKYASLKDFSTQKSIPYDTLRRKAAKDKWLKIDTVITQKAEERMIENEAEELVRMHRKHRKVGAYLFAKNAKYLKDNSPKNVVQALMGLKTGTDLEKSGFVEQNQSPITQFNQQNIIYNEVVETVERDPGLRRDMEKFLRKRLASR